MNWDKMLCDYLGDGKIRTPLLHCIPVICTQVCWRRQEKRHNSSLLHITVTVIKCLSGTLVPVSGSGEQVDAAVCCHARIGTDSTPRCTGELFAQALQLLELWDIEAACKGQDKISQPCVWFACHYLGCQGCPAARGPLCDP